MKLYDKEELKDSRIFFDKNPPRYMSMLIIFITFCIFVGVCFSFVTIKLYVIKAEGIVNSSDNRYISSKTSGEVHSIEKKEGDYVQKGDRLFIIYDGKEDEQVAISEPLKNELNERLDAVNVYIESLQKETNLLSNNGVEQSYYAKMEYFLSNIKDNNDIKEKNEEQLILLKNKLSKMLNEQSELQNQISVVDDYLKSDLQEKLEIKQKEIESLNISIKEVEYNLLVPSSSNIKLQQQLLSEGASEKQSLEEQIAQLQGQQEVSEIEKNIKNVTALNEGYVHYVIPLKEGMSVQMNQTIASVSKNEDCNLMVEANVRATDISKIEVGQSVNIEIEGVNAQKYGTIPGKIESISNGTFMRETPQGNILFYLCNISVDKTKLIASDGDSVKLINSMPVNVSIIYDKETYFDWMKKLLNFNL